MTPVLHQAQNAQLQEQPNPCGSHLIALRSFLPTRLACIKKENAERSYLHSLVHEFNVWCTCRALLAQCVCLQGATAARALREQEERAMEQLQLRENEDAALVRELCAISERTKQDVGELDQEAVRTAHTQSEVECLIELCNLPIVCAHDMSCVALCDIL
jgi:hypothetical protein